MREHGIDFSLWRQWAKPDNPPKPLDFVIAGITYGDVPNQMYEPNKLAYINYVESGGNLAAYHFYTPVSALSQIKAFVPRAAEIGAFGAAIDIENTTAHTINENDIPVIKDIIYGMWQAYPKDRVMAYCSHSKWTWLRSFDPAFFDQVELWLSWPNQEAENTDNFHPLYADKMGRNFEDVRILQYSWEGDAQAYGVLNSPIYIDLDVYVNKQPFDEWLAKDEPEPPEEPEEENDMGILERIEAEIAELKDMQVEANALTVQILALVKDSGGTEEPPAEEPETIGKTVDRDGNNVFLFFAAEYNAKGAPWFQIYPGNTSDVADRLYIPSGTVVQVFADGRTVGDGGAVAWKVDKDQLSASGAPIPEDDLYIMEKFIV